MVIVTSQLNLIGDKKKELLALVEKAKKNSDSLGFLGDLLALTSQ